MQQLVNSHNEVNFRHKKEQESKNLPEKGKFDREKKGKFECIFPINSRTEELASLLNRQVGIKASMGAPNYLKMLVEELKVYETEYASFVTGGRRYAEWISDKGKQTI